MLRQLHLASSSLSSLLIRLASGDLIGQVPCITVALAPCDHSRASTISASLILTLRLVLLRTGF